MASSPDSPVCVFSLQNQQTKPTADNFPETKMQKQYTCV